MPTLQKNSKTLLQDACAHLIQVDKRLTPFIEKHPCHLFSPQGLAEKKEPFESLVSGIISQQVSGAAARSIKAKFIGLFSKKLPELSFPIPLEVAAFSIEDLKSAGLSQRKAEYIQGLAEKFSSEELNAQMLCEASDEALFEKLITVRGLGKWSIEMFAIFCLKRIDIFSVDDLGIQRGMAAFTGKDISQLKSQGGKWKYMSKEEMLQLSKKFAPYRSLFMWLMWRVQATDVSTLE